MMTLEKIREEYHFYTGKVSEVARQFAFAGIAVVWIFKADRNGLPKLPHGLLWPTAVLVLSLLFDFLQYAYGATAYHIRYEQVEKEKKKNNWPDTETYKVSRNLIVRPMDAFFYLKAICIIVAYVMLAVFVIRSLF